MPAQFDKGGEGHISQAVSQKIRKELAGSHRGRERARNCAVAGPIKLIGSCRWGRFSKAHRADHPLMDEAVTSYFLVLILEWNEGRRPLSRQTRRKFEGFFCSSSLHSACAHRRKTFHVSKHSRGGDAFWHRIKLLRP